MMPHFSTASGEVGAYMSISYGLLAHPLRYCVI